MMAAPVASGSDMASLPAVWAYILPALDHVMRSNPDSSEAPPLDVNYHMGVYTVVYNFATAGRAEKAGTSPAANSGAITSGPSGSTGRSRNMMVSHGFNLALGLPGHEGDDPFGPAEGSTSNDLSKDWNLDRAERVKSMVGYELYCYLEDYFRGVARQIRSNAPNEDSALLPYYLASYTRYASGVAIINRLFAYLNRHFIARAVDEGMGWISVQDVLKQKRTGKTTKKDLELLEARKKEALKQWGFNGGGPEQRRFAEACAEAASPSDRIVPVASLAYRCWRIEVIEPFLSAGLSKAITNGDGADLPSLLPPSTSSSSSPKSTFNGTISKMESLTISSSPSIEPTSMPALSKSAKKNKKKKKNAKEKGKEADSNEDGTSNADGFPNEGEVSYSEPSTLPPSPSHPPIQPPPIPALPPKGRLNRVVGDLVLTTQGPNAAPARDTALKLSRSLKTSGVNADNIIRKRLDKFLKR